MEILLGIWRKQSISPCNVNKNPVTKSEVTKNHMTGLVKATHVTFIYSLIRS